MNSPLLPAIVAQLTEAIADTTLTETDRLRIRAAQMALLGDLAGAQQALVACQIPQADWDAARRGEIDY